MFYIFSLCALSLARVSCASDTPPPCSSDIYCHGPLLHTVQMNKIYPDSKTFVDMKMKQDANATMQSFHDFMQLHQDTPSKEDVIRFVNATFEPAGQEFEDWIPSDWKENPSFIENIKDPSYKQFAYQLNHIWKDLGRKMKEKIGDEQDLYSIIYVPNPVIVPGGRFREFYYWDSYWIVQGLLLSEMHDTVKGMLTNFAYIVDQYGHIPNGGRVYYQQRSQPPLFIPMVKLYEDFTNDSQFVKDHITSFDKEFNYWITNHSRIVEKDGKNYTLVAYGDNSYGPRPESYSEDVESAAIFTDLTQKEAYYSELKAAAESGWDFSSRWFITNKTNKGNLTNIKARSIIPVDLNAMMFWNAQILEGWHTELGNVDKAEYYKTMSNQILEAVEAVLWHEEVGTWLDYDNLNGVKRDYFYPTNISPLWTGCYNKTNTNKIIKLVRKYLQNNDIVLHGGIPTSQEHTGEQWDFPNAWPPLQHMMIVGLSNTGDEAASRLAYELADIWVQSNYKAFNESDGGMFEKYDATMSGGHGGGGEYEVQLGFGWTNGVVLDLLHRYGDQIHLPVEHATIEVMNAPLTTIPLVGSSHAASPTSVGQVMTGFIALLVTLAAGYIGVSIYRRRSGHQPLKDLKSRPSRTKYTELRNMPKRTRSSR